jgi:ribosomal protein L12E/L44/L45/RPP1/RPP2
MSQANKLEGILHEDKQRPDAIDIRKLYSATDIKAINDRKQEYEKKPSKKSALEELQNVPKKPSAKASAKKKADKKARQRAEKEQEQKELAEKAEKWEAGRSGVNLNSEYSPSS